MSRPDINRRSSTAPTRRELLQSAAALPLIAPVTGFGRWLPGGDDQTLVVLELDGGNDGLNTVLPLDDAAWARARPLLSNVRRGAHKIGGGFALHPSMAGIAGLLRSELAAIVHGVGYAGASRSHFKNRDIWHTGDLAFDKLGVDTTGWLGRAADVLARQGAAVPGLSVGSLEVPLILKAKDVVVPSLNRIEDYQLLVSPGGDRDAKREDLVELVQRSGERQRGADAKALRQFLGSVAKGAVDNAEDLRSSLAGYRQKAEYPQTALGRRLQLLARIIIGGFGTRLFHVNFAGFDTHASQLASHAALLKQFSDAVTALVRDLQGHGKLDQVLVMVQSEFGRRVRQNKSRGTDHGKAGPMFFFGGGVKSGLHGEHPSLSKLDDGDLIHTVDFRALHGRALQFLGLDPKQLLGFAPPATAPRIFG